MDGRKLTTLFSLKSKITMPMSVTTPSIMRTADLKTLPQFAQFILERHYDEFLLCALQLIRDLKVPLLTLYSPEEAEKISNINNTELLLHIAQNNCSLHIKKAINRWRTGHLRSVKSNDAVVDDITLIGYACKAVFLKFLPRYANDPDVLLTVIGEIDAYVLEYTATTFKAFVEVMDDRMDKQVERLEESQTLYKQAQALTHIGNFVWELEKNKLTWSDELYRIYDLDPVNTRITPAIVRIYDHSEDAPAIKSNVAHALDTLEPFSFFYRIVLPNGRIKTIHEQGEILTDGEGRRIKMFGTAQDVTTQKDIERKLMENQVFIQRIADAIPAIITSYNVHSGQYKFINDGLRKLLGYNAQQVFEEGMGFFLKVIHPDDLEGLLAMNTAALDEANRHSGETERIYEFQYRMRHSNGEYRWFHTFETVFQRNQKRQVQLVLNISLDITERVMAQDILVRRTHELQQSNASLEEFAYAASHDLKEPLRKISVFTSRLAQTSVGSNKAEAALFEKVINASLRMQQMIDDLLSLSLVSAATPYEQCDLEAVFQEVLQTFECRIGETGAAITTDGLPKAIVVPAQMRQLFQNLISNSLKFIRPGIAPVILVSHRFLDAGTMDAVNVRNAKAYLELQATDNGIGFEPEFAEKIFAVFYRLHHKHEYEGTGIGLAICRKIVSGYGGAIHASSMPGHGSTFTVTIPQ
jgi:PAS domain S-box-containing protein